MYIESNKVIVRAYVDAFNRADLNAICGCFTSDAVVYGVLGWGEIAKVRPLWGQLITNFQLNLMVESMVEEGDIVAVRYTERGKFVAAFRGVEPTGKSYEVVAMEWFEMRDGKIARRWGARDSASISRQLGMPLA